MTVATSRAETNALLAALRAVHSRIGDAVAPDDATLPYAVLYPSGSGSLSGSVADPYSDGVTTHQLTCVGLTRDSAQALADRLRPVVMGPLTISGRKLLHRSVESSQPARRDDSSKPPLFYAVDTFALTTTPS